MDIDELWEQILELPPVQQQTLLQKVSLCLPAKQEKTPEPESIWDEILTISELISGEDSAKLPHDGSINYKHYLYGHPKEV